MKTCAILILACLVMEGITAQNVGIGTNAPHASAALEVSATNKGLLLPRNANPTANVPTPSAGLVVYNTSTNQPNFYNGSQWQPMAGLAQQFQRSVAYPGVAYQAAPSSVEFIWAVPEGVTQVWIEAWAGGDAGGLLPDIATSDLSTLSGSGGAGSDYLSILLPVEAGNNITINVGKGGTNSFPSAGNSTILYGTARYTVGQNVGISYSVNNVTTSPVPHVIAFAGGEPAAISEQSFAQTSSTTYRRIIAAGKGGNAALGGKGGDGRVITYNMATGEAFPTGLVSSGGAAGSNPGGGGGGGYGSRSNGGPGLVIIHY